MIVNQNTHLVQYQRQHGKAHGLAVSSRQQAEYMFPPPPPPPPPPPEANTELFSVLALNQTEHPDLSKLLE